MERDTVAQSAPTYRARLRGGPDDGAVLRIAPLPGGAPPDFFHAGPDDPGMYVLAGSPNSDGSLPYWFISSQPSFEERPPPEQSTWTLVSVADPEGRPKVWHQHGEDSKPVRLRAEPIGTSRVPSFVGRAYVCPECEEITVISLPEA